MLVWDPVIDSSLEEDKHSCSLAPGSREIDSLGGARLLLCQVNTAGEGGRSTVILMRYLLWPEFHGKGVCVCSGPRVRLLFLNSRHYLPQSLTSQELSAQIIIIFEGCMFGHC